MCGFEQQREATVTSIMRCCSCMSMTFLLLSHKAKEVIEEVTAFYKAKEGSIKEPDIYLGANSEKIQTPDGCIIWASSPRAYVKNAVKTVE